MPSRYDKLDPPVDLRRAVLEATAVEGECLETAATAHSRGVTLDGVRGARPTR